MLLCIRIRPQYNKQQKTRLHSYTDTRHPTEHEHVYMYMPAHKQVELRTSNPLLAIGVDWRLGGMGYGPYPPNAHVAYVQLTYHVNIRTIYSILYNFIIEFQQGDWECAYSIGLTGTHHLLHLWQLPCLRGIPTQPSYHHTH
jgi:hypothetical protein